MANPFVLRGHESSDLDSPASLLSIYNSVCVFSMTRRALSTMLCARSLRVLFCKNFIEIKCSKAKHTSVVHINLWTVCRESLLANINCEIVKL